MVNGPMVNDVRGEKACGDASWNRSSSSNSSSSSINRTVVRGCGQGWATNLKCRDNLPK